MRFFIALSLICFSFAAHSAGVVFLNLHDAQEEVDACRAGIEQCPNGTGDDCVNQYAILQQDANGNSIRDEDGDGAPDDVLSERPNPGDSFYEAKPKAGETGLTALRRTIRKAIAEGNPPDSLVISGESGADEVWGKSGSSISKLDIEALALDFPDIKFESVAYPACYAGTYFNSKDPEQPKTWLNRTLGSEIMMAFPMQSPASKRKGMQERIFEFCRYRSYFVDASKQDALCEFTKQLRNFGKSTVSYCNSHEIVSSAYSNAKYPGMCHSNEELEERCSNFVKQTGDQNGVKKDSWRDTFDRLMSGDLEPIKEEECTKGKCPGRQSYDTAQLWRHCQEQIADAQIPGDDGNPIDIPHPGAFLRLTKFKWMQENLGDSHAKRLANYDARLSELGLDEFALGDFKSLTRKQIVTRLNGAVRALERADGSGSTNPAKLRRMAVCLRQTFVELRTECSRFVSATKDGAGTSSKCVVSYDKANSNLDDGESCAGGG